jgi:hypothetical protein
LTGEQRAETSQSEARRQQLEARRNSNFETHAVSIRELTNEASLSQRMGDPVLDRTGSIGLPQN